jgi:uncharacterized protein (TIGR00303 family)
VVIASTDTALVPGISAAGASAELIPFTAAADAEVLAYGAARCIAGVPSNPAGPPGPAIITRAALDLAAIPHLVVSAGCRIVPDAPFIDLGGYPGGLISQGRAVQDARGLFTRARRLGRELGEREDYLIIAESVPGGTTTALALLLALGIRAEGRVSGTTPGNSHGLKSALARQALERLDAAAVAADPLAAVETLGDPMQAAAAGLAAGALEAGAPVLLAGGTQMIAVVALLRRLAERGSAPDPAAGRVGVATTRWVVEDPTADAVGLMREVSHVPLLATPLSFQNARFASLRAYEENLVKEGVGAGGACVAAALTAGVTPDALLARVEEIYTGLMSEGSPSRGVRAEGRGPSAPHPSSLIPHPARPAHGPRQPGSDPGGRAGPADLQLATAHEELLA